MTLPFEYDTLPTERHVRLLRVSVHPTLGLRNFSFLTISLDAAPSYEAVSYVWGDASNLASITLQNSHTLQITRTLQTALPHLANASRTNLLWIDQLCINQENKKEKGQQVAMMDQIYGRAERVLTWLGEEDQHTVIIEELIAAIGSDPDARHACFDFLEHIKDPLRAKLKPLIRASKARQIAVKSLFDRPWFRRSWVFQEVVLARSVVMLIGSIQFAMRDIDRLSSTIACLQNMDDIGDFQWAITNTKGWEPFWNMVHSQQKWRDGQEIRSFDLFLVEKAGYFEVSDPRDIVYAFLGCKRFQTLKIVPDYTLTTRTVFLRMARAIIDTNETLELLGLAGVPRKKLLCPNMPFWAPDWSAGQSFDTTFWERDDSNEFDACKGFKHRPLQSIDSEDESQLVVHGKIIDTVFARYDQDVGWIDLSRMPLKSWIALDERLKTLGETAHRSDNPLVTTMEKLLTRGKPKFRGELMTRARLLKILIAEGCITPTELFELASHPISPVMTQHRIDKLLKVYDKYGHQNAAEYATRFSNKDVELDLKILRRHSDILKGRVVFETPKKKFGLTTRGVRKGDVITILHGSGYPVILRKNRFEGTNATSNTWKLVGQCYLEGAMRGELVDWSENEAQAFVIV